MISLIKEEDTADSLHVIFKQMAKQTHNKAATVKSKRLPETPLKISYLIILIAYGYVTVVTPNLQALDSNGPKFMTLAFLNLLTFVFLFTKKEFRSRSEWYYSFFTSKIGIAYAGLMIVSLLSFFKAINILESVLHFTKVFTTFSAAYLVSILIYADKRNIPYLCVAMTLLLIYDSVTIFSGINKFLNGKLSSIGELKTVYSNKNILASSIFVKIPFALWLMVYNRNWLKIFGMIGLLCGITATFFMSTRAFYVGTIALTLVIIIFFIIRYTKTKDKYNIRLTAIFLIIVFCSFGIFSSVQKFLYPKESDGYTVSVAARMSTITDPGGAFRLEGWKRSWNVFKEDPILGIGLGNWKIATLKEENQTSVDFTYQYKAHNDFIETTAETGIFGGFLFLSIFVLSGWILLVTLLNDATSEKLKFFFLPAMGLFCYSFDANFNFPQDRPEMQALFGLYVGLAVALYSSKNLVTSNKNTKDFSSILNRIRDSFPFLSKSTNLKGQSHLSISLIIIYGLILTACSYILILNFNSLKLQRFIKVEINREKLTLPASKFLNGFPSIPDINVVGEPIAVQKARYLINEKRYDEAITLLKNDQSSPYDTRKEYFIAMSYNSQNNIDSSLAYSQKAYNMKPCFFKNIAILCNLLQKKGMIKEGDSIVSKYLSVTKTNKEAWLYASSFYDKAANMNKAVSVIDSAARYFPTDTLVLKQKSSIHRKAVMVLYQGLRNEASAAFNAKRYDDAARLYSELLIKAPTLTEARNFRAFCYYYLKEYVKSNNDIDILISSGMTQSNLFNLRGVNYYNLGNKDEACKNYKIAADMGDKDGLNNYPKLCQPVKK